MQSTSNRDPALVRQRSDDQASCSAHIFVPVLKHRLNLTDNALLLLIGRAFNLFVVVTKLLLPVEVKYIIDIVFSEVTNDCP